MHGNLCCGGGGGGSGGSGGGDRGDWIQYCNLHCIMVVVSLQENVSVPLSKHIYLSLAGKSFLNAINLNCNWKIICVCVGGGEA